MINYSITMRSVNANLFEINAAKARIKQAKKDGVEPAQADVDLVATEVQHAYGVAQYTDVMDIEKFAKHISTHGCVYSRADVSAILYLAVDCMREQLLEGKKIRLGDLGDFSVTITTTGAETAEKFSAQNITAVNVVWDCGTQFKNLLSDAQFQLVASRSAQSKVLKAIKAGENTVNLNTTDENADSTETDTQTGGSTSGDTTPQDSSTSGNGSSTSGGSSNPVTPSGSGSSDDDEGAGD